MPRRETRKRALATVTGRGGVALPDISEEFQGSSAELERGFNVF